MTDYDYLYKIILIGDSGVGKSNILSRFTRDAFSPETRSTIGVEFATRNVTDGDKVIKAQIWDTAGQERYRTITRAYYRGCVGIIIVYDITKATSFRSLEKWLAEITANGSGDAIKILVGNKCDLSQYREVSTVEAKTYAEKNNMFFLETSALSATNIESIFQTVVSAAHTRSKTDTTVHNTAPEWQPSSSPISIVTTSKSNSGCSC